MKKVLTLILAALLALSLTACARAGSGGLPAGSQEAENAALREENASLRAQLEEAQAAASSGNAVLPDTSANAGQAAAPDPIDPLFQPYWDSAQTTAAMVQIAAQWKNAWYGELAALVQDLERESSQEEDRKDLEAYLENAKKQGEVAAQMVYRAGAGADTPRKDRPAAAGSAAGYLAAISAKDLYRSAFYALYNARYPAEPTWEWKFNPDAARGILEAALYGG